MHGSIVCLFHVGNHRLLRAESLGDAERRVPGGPFGSWMLLPIACVRLSATRSVLRATVRDALRRRGMLMNE